MVPSNATWPKRTSPAFRHSLEPLGEQSSRHAPQPRAAQFHRFGQSAHEDAGRRYSRLYRSSRRRCRALDHRRAGTDEPRQRCAPTRADAGAHPDQHGPTGARTVGRCGGLLRVQSQGVESPPPSRRHRHGSAPAWRGLGHGTRPTIPRTRVHAMKIRLRRAGHRSRYRLRTQVVEPVFGQIKHGRGFRQFLLQGGEGLR